jgi:hypothetical protein
MFNQSHFNSLVSSGAAIGGNPDYMFGFDRVEDIQKIVANVGMYPTSMSIQVQPEYKHQNTDADGNTIFRVIGPDYSTYRIEGFLHCETLFNEAQGFRYNGVSFFVEERSIDRSNTDYITCVITGSAYSMVILPDIFINQDGAALGSTPVVDGQIVTVAMPPEFVGTPVNSLVDLSGPSGSPTIKGHFQNFVDGVATFLLEATPQAGLNYALSYRADENGVYTGSTSYQWGVENIAVNQSSVAVTHTAVTDAWWNWSLVIPPGGTIIEGHITENSLSTTGFTFEFDAPAETSGQLAWIVRDVNEEDDLMAFGYVTLGPGEERKAIDYSSQGWQSPPAFQKVNVSKPNDTSDSIDASIIVSSVTEKGMVVILDSPVPAGETRYIYWQAIVEYT